MGESASQIAQELDQKRADATEKIEQIENQVTQAAEDIKETVDIRRQVEQRPLVSLGAAFIGGIVLGGLVGGDSGNGRNAPAYYRYDGSSSSGSSGQGGSGLMEGIRSAAKKAGLEDAINSAAAAMMANAGDRIKSTMNQTYPGFAEKYQSASHASGGMPEKTKAASSTESQTAQAT
jgi:hypothetical protein